jgi:ABC-type sugar transport system substrate-binding protein
MMAQQLSHEARGEHPLQGKIAVVGIDATREAVRAVKAGRLAGDVAMYPETLGRNAVEAAIKAARGEPVEKRIHTGQALVTRENADDFLR